MIRRRESYDKKEKKPNNITSKNNHKDQDVGLILIMSGLIENFRTREPDFYRKLYLTKFRGDDTKTYQ